MSQDFIPQVGNFGRMEAAGGLPIFHQVSQSWVDYYAPGHLTRSPISNRIAFEAELLSVHPTGEAASLLQHAQHATKVWEELHSQSYVPLCLTVYLNNVCNLACIYCYANPLSYKAVHPRPSLGALEAAAQQVAENCSQMGSPFTLVLHGGGEPTLDQAYADQVLELVDRIAESHRLPIFRYIATNGVMPASRVRWLARRFDLVGLSCDGPAEIQSAQRPLRNGGSSTAYVERTASILHESDQRFHIRLTVTPCSSSRLEEITQYLCQQLQPQEIHIEPVYTSRRAEDGLTFTPDQAQDFVNHFLNAGEIARAHNIPWSMSGCRPQEIHGPYCQILSRVLHLIPGDGVSACFKSCDLERARQSHTWMGAFDIENGLALDPSHLDDLRQTILGRLPDCQGCLNRYHCTRGCPDFCPLQPSISAQADLLAVGSFRCRVNLALMQATLHRAALSLETRLRADPMIGSAGIEIAL